jgi:CheY-like chemotaxis protein
MEASEPRKILYIEDNKTNAMLVTKVLQNIEDVELYCAASGEEGIELARSMSPDLVLLDIGLPGMSGYDVLRHIREDSSLAGTRVVAMTASASEDDVAVGVQVGFDAYLTKPFDIRHFLRLLDKLLDVRR